MRRHVWPAGNADEWEKDQERNSAKLSLYLYRLPSCRPLLSHRKLHEGGFAAGQAFEGHGFFAGGAELVTGAFFPLRAGDAFPGPAQRCEGFLVELGNVLNREGGVAKNKRRAVSQLHAFGLGRDGRIPFQDAGATEGDELGVVHSIEILNDGAILNEALLELFCFDGDFHAFRIGFAVLVPPQLLVGLAVVIADGGDLLRGGELQ